MNPAINRGLSLPNHVIEKYRERVAEDNYRLIRTDNQIRDIIMQAFQEAVIPSEGIERGYHVLVNFHDLDGNSFSAPYYLVVDRDMTGARFYVAKTIKDFRRTIEKQNSTRASRRKKVYWKKYFNR